MMLLGNEAVPLLEGGPVAVALKERPLAFQEPEERPALVDHIPALRRYALFLCQDRDRADDLVQECLLRAMAHLDRFQPGTNVRAWLLAILRNYFYNNDVRRGGRERPFASPEEEATLAPAIAPPQPHAVALREMERAILSLPDDQREVLLLIGVEGMSYEEAAQMLAVPVGTVRSRLSRARQRLLALMGDDPDATG